MTHDEAIDTLIERASRWLDSAQAAFNHPIDKDTLDSELENITESSPTAELDFDLAKEVRDTYIAIDILTKHLAP